MAFIFLLHHNIGIDVGYSSRFENIKINTRRIENGVCIHIFNCYIYSSLGIDSFCHRINVEGIQTDCLIEELINRIEDCLDRTLTIGQ